MADSVARERLDQLQTLDGISLPTDPLVVDLLQDLTERVEFLETRLEKTVKHLHELVLLVRRRDEGECW